MKNARQNAIIRLIEENAIETQEELVQALMDKGFKVTQATVSRDIKQLALVKMLTPERTYRYALPGKNTEDTMSDRFIDILSEAIVTIHCAYNQIIIKTIPASADIGSEIIDRFGWKEVLGSIAGENTILLIIRSIEEVPAVMEKLNQLKERNSSKRG